MTVLWFESKGRAGRRTAVRHLHFELDRSLDSSPPVPSHPHTMPRTSSTQLDAQQKHMQPCPLSIGACLRAACQGG